jgi:hypothetical protein
MPKTLNVETRKALVSTKAIKGTEAAATLRNLIRLAVNNAEATARALAQGESLKCQLAKGFRDYCGAGWETAEGSSSQGMKRDAMIKELYDMAKDKGKDAYNAARKMMHTAKAFAAGGYKDKVRAKGINKGRKPGERDSLPVFFEKAARNILTRYYTDGGATDKDEEAMEYIRLACAVYGFDIRKEMAMAPKAGKPKTK